LGFPKRLKKMESTLSLEDTTFWDEGFRYRPGPSPCERCGHRRDMHERVNGIRRCRACDYIALRFPCSTETLRAEKVLDSLAFDVADATDEPG